MRNPHRRRPGKSRRKSPRSAQLLMASSRDDLEASIAAGDLIQKDEVDTRSKHIVLSGVDQRNLT